MITKKDLADAQAAIHDECQPLAADPCVTNEQLLKLGTIFARQQVARMLADTEAEKAQANGVIAGVVAALHELLPAAQFRHVLIQWEIDPIALTTWLEIATANPEIEG